MTEKTPQQELSQTLDKIYSKIVLQGQAIFQTMKWQQQGLTVAVIDTVFDLPTYKHKEYTVAVKRYCDKLVCRIDTDKHVREKKGENKPYIDLEKRQKDACYNPYIDLITTKEKGGIDWIKYYRPNVVVKSITSGSKLVAEIEELEKLADTTALDLKIIILDENCNEVSKEEALILASNYENNKYTDDKFSGSVIARKIQDSFILENQDNLRCDI